MKSLKEKNRPFIILFLLWCSTIYILFLTGFQDFWSDFASLFTELGKKNNTVMTISPLLCFIFTGLISSQNKEILVFWRKGNPLPGSRAFSELASRDWRIDVDLLEQKIGPFPQTPEEQNYKWYSLYKYVENKVTVSKEHQYFLLARDLASISFLFLLLTPWALYFESQISMFVLVLYICIFFVQYVILCIVAQNHANRFVCNVLIEYCLN